MTETTHPIRSVAVLGAGTMGAQIAAHAAVRIHVRNDLQYRALEQPARNGIEPVDQALDHAFDEPLCHRFAGMLARDDPDRLLPGSS